MELVDVLLGDGPFGGAHRGVGVSGQEVALASHEQHLRDAGSSENADVPCAPVGDVGQHLQSEAGQAGLDRGVATDQFGVSGGEPEGADSADVLAGEMHGSEFEVLD